MEKNINGCSYVLPWNPLGVCLCVCRQVCHRCHFNGPQHRQHRGKVCSFSNYLGLPLLNEQLRELSTPAFSHAFRLLFTL